MKKLALIITLLLIAAAQLKAQSWIEKMGDRVKDKAVKKVEQRIEKNAAKATDKALDKTEESISKIGSKSQDKVVETIEWTEMEPGEIEKSMEHGMGVVASKQEGQSKQVISAYMKSDFIAGDEIFFEDLVIGEKMGEFPSQWDLLEGVSEVAEINGIKAIAFEPGGFIVPLMDDMANYLPDVFTLEFDFWINDNRGEKDQEYELFFYKGKERYTVNALMHLIFGNPDSDRKGSMKWSFRTPANEIRKGEGFFEIIENSWHHLAISFNQRSFKAYINGVRVINIPAMAEPKTLAVYASTWGGMKPGIIAITNVRMAKGAVPLYDRLISGGKFISYGITFDIGKSTLKPESYSELNRIVTLMKENPELKFSVEGHTDSTGSEASNQTLSEQRSQAVIDELAKMGVGKNRLSASGKGQASPIADNGTDEGRAKNRRVEFVKL